MLAINKKEDTVLGLFDQVDPVWSLKIAAIRLISVQLELSLFKIECKQFIPRLHNTYPFRYPIDLQQKYFTAFNL